MPNFERRLDARLVVSVAAVGIMSFAGVVVETALNIAFPALMEEFGVTTASVQWVTTAYLLVLAAIMPISSFLNRRFRNKALFLAAMAVFLAGTAVCAAAPNFILLVAGRILQGIGAGIALPLMFNIVLQQAPVGKLGVMMGFATLIIAIAPAVGPSFGGFLVEAFGWRSIFLVLLPFLGLSLVLGALTVRQARDVEKASFSPVQFVLVAAGFTALVVAANAASESAWTSPKTLGLLALAFALLTGFTWISLRSDMPLLRVRIFADRTYSLSLVYAVLIQAAVLALGYLIPYLAQAAKSMGSFAAGCLLLPGCVIGAILTPFGGRLLDRLGAKRPILIGAAVGVATLACFAAFGIEGSAVRLAFIYPFFPICQALSLSNSMTNGLRSLPEELQADGNAAFNTLQQLGGAIGTAVAAAIVNSAQAGSSGDLVAGTTAGAQAAFYVLLGAGAVAFAAALGVFFRPRQGQAEKRSRDGLIG